MKSNKILLVINFVALLFVTGFASANEPDDSTNSTATTQMADKIDVNEATIEQLIEIKGIGKSKANAIIKYRKEIGGFNSMDELIGVKGIGNKALGKLKLVLKV